jgi:hypothetical protein
MLQKLDSGNGQLYSEWLTNFGATSAGGGSADSTVQLGVPEPTTALLMAAGLLAACAVRRPKCRR